MEIAHGTARSRQLGATVQFALQAGPLLSMVDSSIVNVALPSIARETASGLAQVQWTVSGYLLALGVGLSLTPYLARKLGGKNLYIAAMAGFTLASLMCATVPSLELLVAARVLQGICGAPLVPLAMGMLLGNGRGAKSVSPVAGVLLFAAPAFGPSLGGLLIGAGGWRWIFLVNVPIGILAVASARRIPAEVAPARQEGAGFDVVGFVLLAAGLVGVLSGVDAGSSRGWDNPRTVLLLGGGAVLLAAYAWHALRRSNPVVDLAALRSRGPTLSIVLCGLASVSTYSAILLVPTFAQAVQGHSAVATGLAMLPAGIMTGLGASLGSWLQGRIGVRVMVLGGLALLGGSTLLLLLVTAGTPLAVTAIILTGRSASIGLVSTPLLLAMSSRLTDTQATDANTLFNIVQRVAGSLGVALVATLYASGAASVGPVAALHHVGLVLTALTVVALLGALWLPRSTDSENPRGEN
ncbi:hypothetical protein AL755_20745 [Arthrobacter sp. ERGS1:01]|uniref:DHA2 family efflux MFS transporter permease subunit n=1 Tax=Arthrobacter sp. ERGS1:01 TaxID=1704044 RepID=UPI0006B5FAC8|nr:DHA2 family efflux MFS transporter permease subunit [Arthrobacter sp. ERGS1:01]ALE07347.1 hypothetical protein AL755_20745 [Arthrobacter sp. ERGS1:01]